MKKHPMQKIAYDGHDVIRFVENPIVSYVLEAARKAGVDMNHLAMVSERMGWDLQDHEQFAQLIGYSVSGFGELPYCDGRTIAKADRIAHKLYLERHPATQPQGESS